MDPTQAEPVGLVLPLDEDWALRLAVADRLYRRLTGGEDAAPPLSPQRRARLKRALRTIDAQGDGASYRTIATHVFGARRVAQEAWKTSSLKAQMARLAASGRKMIAQGYRTLLKGRSR